MDSAVYQDGLVQALAEAAFVSVIAWRRRAHELAEPGGVENPVINEMMHSLDWYEERR